MTDYRDLGTSPVVVRLGPKGQPAVLQANDKAALDALGVPEYWFVRWNRVVYRHPIWPRQYVQVARILTGCQFGQTVRYRDRNPFNLLRDNLKRVKGNIDTCPLEEFLKDLPKVLRERTSPETDMKLVEAFVSRVTGRAF